MEFDKNSPISDEQRHIAETKQVTVQPLHPDVQPENQPDAEIIAQRVRETPLANIPNDIEQDTSPVQPSKELLGRKDTKPTRRSGVVFAIALPIIIAVTLATYLFLK